MTTSEQFAKWLSAPEGRHLEFKAASNNYDADKLARYCVALANAGGGQIILGVTDKRPRTVPGTTAFQDPGRIEGDLYRELHQRISIEEYDHHGTRVIIVHVPARLPGTAWSYRGSYLKREGEDLIAMSENELRLIFAETGPDYSAEPSRAALSDLDPAAIAEFRQRWARKTNNPRLALLSDEETLRDAELSLDGQPLIAALILFGTRATLGRYLAQAEIVFEYRSSEASGPAADREEYRQGFFAIQDALWQKVNLRNDRQSYQQDFFRYDIPTFDEVSIREALLNAIAHRDYRLPGSIFVRQYARRLEIVSPGGFPPGITVENIVDQQNPRNRRLAEALAKAGLVERSGQGLNLMIENAIKQTKPQPNFSGTAAHEVRLTMAGTVQNPSFIRYLERLGDEQLARFSTHDFMALEALHRDQPLSSAQLDRMNGLIECGAVERIGRGKSIRYLLSKELYAALGEPGTYTRRKGLDRDTNKELLFKHIRDNDARGSPLAHLRQVLPAQSDREIRWLLELLLGEGRVQKRGKTKDSLWHTSPPLPGESTEKNGEKREKNGE